MRVLRVAEADAHRGAMLIEVHFVLEGPVKILYRVCNIDNINGGDEHDHIARDESPSVAAANAHDATNATATASAEHHHHAADAATGEDNMIAFSPYLVFFYRCVLHCLQSRK